MDTGQPITDQLVRKLELPAGKRKMIVNDAPAGPRDRAFVPGFGVRLTTGGAKTFVLRYRADGRDRTMKIGAYGPWSVAAARERAAELRRAVDDGHDPQAARSAVNAAPTLADVFGDFCKDFAHSLRPSTLAGYQMQFRLHVAGQLGRRKIAQVDFADIQTLHGKLSKESPTMANRVLALLSRLFNVALRKRLVTENPCRGIGRNQETKRKRYLRPDEVRRMLAALPQLRHEQSADAIRLLMLTGARRMEVLSANWSQFDLEAGVWIKPAASTKQKAEHQVPLSAAALDVLKAMKKRTGGKGFICPGESEAGHQQDLKKAWASVRKLAELPDVRLHDLRHSYASFLASGGASLPLIGAMLGHTQAQTTARYAHLFDTAQRAAADQVGAAIASMGTGQ
jgi:integrase